jgi:hypothetical protein
MMSCLTDAQCSALLDDLDGEARRWTQTHLETFRALTRTELEALAEGMRNNAAPDTYALNAWRTEAGRLHAEGDPTLWEAWQAMRRGTTKGLSDLARQRYETRRAIIGAILDLAEGVASVVLPRVGEALLRRLR